MRSLKFLYLSGNGYSGNIDSFKLPSLIELNINTNRVRGTLPLSVLNGRNFTVFDISHNHISGFLGINIYTSVINSTYATSINRLSGDLDLDSIRRFLMVDIIKGNLFSCRTLPADDKTPLDEYNCGSSDLEASLYVWLSLVGVCAALLMCLTRIQYLESLRAEFGSVFPISMRSFETHINAEVRAVYQLTLSLTRLLRFVSYLSLVIFVVSITIYLSLKLGPSGDLYKTHNEQYWEVISGFYLMTSIPACLIMLMYLTVFGILVFAYWRLFVVDWSAMAFARPVFSEPLTGGSGIQSCGLLAYRIFIVVCFITLSLFANALYVTGILFTSRFLILYQVFLFLFNTVYRLYLLPLLIEHIFKTSKEGTSATSISVYAAILSIADIVNPWLATLVTDDLCFRGVLINQGDITASYTYTRCTTPDVSSGSCLQYTSFPLMISFVPPFIYSNQCRIAIFVNFVPVIIYTSAYNAFIAPLVYLFQTWNLTNLAEHYSIFGIRLAVQNWILPNVTYQLVFIINEISLILIYGLVSPYCVIALGMSSAVRMITLRSRIYRYCNLQFTSIVDVGSIGRDKNHIDEICREAHRYLHLLIWPSLILSSFLMALFLLDMAYDDENSPSLVGLFSIFMVTVLGVQVIGFVFLRSKACRDRVLQQNLQSIEDEMNKKDLIASANTEAGVSAGILVSSRRNSSKSNSNSVEALNPLRGIIELRTSNHLHSVYVEGADE